MAVDETHGQNSAAPPQEFQLTQLTQLTQLSLSGYSAVTVRFRSAEYSEYSERGARGTDQGGRLGTHACKHTAVYGPNAVYRGTL